jgi:cyclopropane fatty-acyl-phospholipid synthase-like methyltransferase
MVMRKFYREAGGNPERLPWHRDNVSKVLESAVAALKGRCRALDIGCGAGAFSVWLAERGMDVTGIDLFPEAIEMAQALATERSVQVNFVSVDLFTYDADRPFDLVFDSGCLHSLVGGNVDSYKRRLLHWLAPDGDYVLEHWGKRHALDWRPIGPRRRSPALIERMFAPELTLLETEVTDFAAPLPFGPMVRGVGYWFRRRLQAGSR